MSAITVRVKELTAAPIWATSYLYILCTKEQNLLENQSNIKYYEIFIDDKSQYRPYLSKNMYQES